MMSKMTVALAAAMAMTCARAEASPVRFTLINTTYNDVAMDAGAVNGTPLGGFQLTIDSAAVARGSFLLRGFVTPAYNTIIGDRADFLSATTPRGDGVSPVNIYSTFNTQLTFDELGFATGTIDFGTDQSGLTISGTSSQFTGTFGGDQTHCGATLCRVSGQLLTTGYTPVSVPEPLSAALVLTGLLGLGLRLQRSR